MDTLRFGTVELLGSAHQTTVRNGQRQVPALELRLAGPADQAALAAMQEHALEILDENGAVQGKHTGYTVLTKHSVVLAQADPTDRRWNRQTPAMPSWRRSMRRCFLNC